MVRASPIHRRVTASSQFFHLQSRIVDNSHIKIPILKMSTQAARSIPFTHTTPQQGFRLLELSPELMELISSNEAPTYVPHTLHYSIFQTNHSIKTKTRTKIPPSLTIAN